MISDFQGIFHYHLRIDWMNIMQSSNILYFIANFFASFWSFNSMIQLYIVKLIMDIYIVTDSMMLIINVFFSFVSFVCFAMKKTYKFQQSINNVHLFLLFPKKKIYYWQTIMMMVVVSKKNKTKRKSYRNMMVINWLLSG